MKLIQKDIKDKINKKYLSVLSVLSFCINYQSIHAAGYAYMLTMAS